MEPLKYFISDLAGEFAQTYGLTAEDAQAEAERVEAQNRKDIVAAMRRGFGVIVFQVTYHRLAATFGAQGMTNLRRIGVALS